MIAAVVPVDTLVARPDAVVADVRWYLDGRSGRAAYEAGHLPGAVFIDLDRWLAGPPSATAGRHPLPDPETFAEGMRCAGVSSDSTVLAYDDAGGVIAARLVWMLRATGHDAALLDGGLAGFDGVLETGSGQPRPTGRFAATPWPADSLASIDDAASGSPVLLDARDAARYRGDEEPVDPRAGHIPGAQNIPCRSNLGSDLRLLPVDELRRRFTQAGVSDQADVVAYCGSGVTACHLLLTLEHAGFAPGRLFPGSWSQYSATGRPAATGA
jgi:thiosulfate/3-mercaptopyruvate sulfurtransferase